LLTLKQTEQDRLDFQHTSTTILLDGLLAWAPLNGPPRNVLDVATGTGIWANEFARQNPTSNVVGSDLSLIQPEENKPPNCSFVQEDAEDSWIVHQVSYDYIHLRFVHTCFDNPRAVIKSAFDNLAPGGWIEFQDTGPEIDCAPEAIALLKFNSFSIQGSAAMGRDIVVSKHYKDWLIQTGCESYPNQKPPRSNSIETESRYDVMTVLA
jgi:ubiquinone/menaquinone biosynthesis C-methylase UbiE